MGRIHAPELEDEPWFPAALRDGLTDFLEVAAVRLRLFDAVVPLVADLLRRTGAPRVVDLCSGGGGPLLSVAAALEARHGLDVEIVLTDKYPNEAAFARAERARPGRVEGRRASVDATAVPEDLPGLRTLFNALHHFRPAQARAILEDACAKAQPIAVFEIVERRPATMAFVAGTPFACLALTPLTRPSIQRLAFTYALPVVPACVFWDGLASCLRAYSRDELTDLVAPLQRPGYRWSIGRARIPYTPARVTWLVGEPEAG